MKFHQLAGLKKKRPTKRKGRGIAAGQGKTAGRGTKGQNSRSGGRVRPHFEGGQTPLVRRLPKKAGFRSHRLPAEVIYSGQLDGITTSSKVIDNHVLARVGLVTDAYSRVKLIKKGAITKAHRISLQAVSAAARTALEKAGGSFELSARSQRPASEKKAGRSSSRFKATIKKDAPAATDVVK